MGPSKTVGRENFFPQYLHFNLGGFFVELVNMITLVRLPSISPRSLICCLGVSIALPDKSSACFNFKMTCYLFPLKMSILVFKHLTSSRLPIISTTIGGLWVYPGVLCKYLQSFPNLQFPNVNLK